MPVPTPAGTGPGARHAARRGSAAGRVPLRVPNLFAVMVHVLGESDRHAGHADILREGLDGRTGVRPECEQRIDEEARAAFWANVEQAAGAAAPTAELTT